MILPTKHLRLRQSLVGCGALILQHLRRPRKISGLWDDVRAEGHIKSFDKFVATLDALFLLGIIERRGDRVAVVRGGQQK